MIDLDTNVIVRVLTRDDTADALHLASLGPARRLATFDRRLSKGAAGISGAPGVQLLRG
jgi:predicted nucleic acid-binding protein